jgi:hypothetical protein
MFKDKKDADQKLAEALSLFYWATLSKKSTANQIDSLLKATWIQFQLSGTAGRRLKAIQFR